MSFNENHIINSDNFQELCLLYIDGELTPQEGDALVAFAASHPHLQEELAALQATKLDVTPLRFEGKESLLSFNLDTAGDESLLLYIDHELPAGEMESVAHRLASDQRYLESFRQLKAATLDRSETVSFPDKAILYRRTGATVRPLSFLRVAVAVVLLLAGAIFWLTTRNITQTAPPPIVQAPKETVVPGGTGSSTVAQNNTAHKNEKVPEAAQEVALDEKRSVPGQSRAVARNRVKVAPQKAPLQQPRKFSLPIQEGQVIAGVDPADKVVPVHDKINTATDPSQHTLNNPLVTTPSNPPYTTTDAAAPTDSGLSYAASFNSNSKKGSVRGFLRKATRFIERRTGINPVNDDDELLIGVVAIKL
jgi:anti-sigma factor RsiW